MSVRPFGRLDRDNRRGVSIRQAGARRKTLRPPAPLLLFLFLSLSLPVRSVTQCFRNLIASRSVRWTIVSRSRLRARDNDEDNEILEIRTRAYITFYNWARIARCRFDKTRSAKRRLASFSLRSRTVIENIPSRDGFARFEGSCSRGRPLSKIA